MIENVENNLREQVMVNQFMIATGCTKEQSRQLLQSCRWEFEMALSSFFQEASAAHMHRIHAGGAPFGTMAAPTNTPATPPSFGDVLLTLGNLKANGDLVSPPSGAASGICISTAPAAPTQGQQKVLSPCNCMSPPSSIESRYYVNYCDWPVVGMMSPPLGKQPNYPPSSSGSSSAAFHRQTPPVVVAAGGSPPRAFIAAPAESMDTENI